MNPLLDHVLSRTISWRLHYLECSEISDLEFERLKLEYLSFALECIRLEELPIDSAEDLAEYLESILDRAKEKAVLESDDLYRELKKYNEDHGGGPDDY